MKLPTWHKRRPYKHFDQAVTGKFLNKIQDTNFVSRHSFSPLLHYIKQEKRYKPKDGKTEFKDRDIMYASHRDAAILAYYSQILNNSLDTYYNNNGLSDHVIAYRSLGKANYHFAADAYKFAKHNAPCTILAFDVSGFFDHLDHKLLKSRLKNVLNVSSLTNDWLKILKFATRYHYVELDELNNHSIFSERLKDVNFRFIGTIKELKDHGIKLYSNKSSTFGIPQGTPISATLSNLYMIDFDAKIKLYCDSIGAYYRRYSDDILIICNHNEAKNVKDTIISFMKLEKLELSSNKTEETQFDAAAHPVKSSKSAQYLGFSYYPGGAGIRPSSLSRQWRKLKRNIRKAKKKAKEVKTIGEKLYTKSLRRRFTPLQFRNFSSYARCSSKEFGEDNKIRRQARRLRSGLIDQSQKMTVAAMAIAEKKV